MSVLGGWKGVRRVRTEDGFVRDEYPRAGLLMLVVMHVFSFVVGAGLAFLLLLYMMFGDRHGRRVHVPADDAFLRALFTYGPIAGGILGMGVCAWYVVASRLADRRRRELDELAELERATRRDAAVDDIVPRHPR